MPLLGWVSPGARCDLRALSPHSCPSLEVVSVRKAAGGQSAQANWPSLQDLNTAFTGLKCDTSFPLEKMGREMDSESLCSLFLLLLAYLKFSLCVCVCLCCEISE